MSDAAKTQADLTVGICLRHPRFLDCTRPFRLLGGPHVRFALAALKESNVCERLYFLSASEAENRAARELGFQLIPWVERECDNERAMVRDHVNQFISDDLGAAHADLSSWGRLRSVVKTEVYVDANLLFLTARTIREMVAHGEQGCPTLFASTPVRQRLMLPQQSGAFMPLLYDTTQDHYLPEQRPMPSLFFPECRVENPHFKTTGRPSYMHHPLPDMESHYVNDEMSAEMAEAYIESRREEVA